jgi:hypothetical protein
MGWESITALSGLGATAAGIIGKSFTDRGSTANTIWSALGAAGTGAMGVGAVGAVANSNAKPWTKWTMGAGITSFVTGLGMKFFNLGSTANKWSNGLMIGGAGTFAVGGIGALVSGSSNSHNCCNNGYYSGYGGGFGGGFGMMPGMGFGMMPGMGFGMMPGMGFGMMPYGLDLGLSTNPLFSPDYMYSYARAYAENRDAMAKEQDRLGKIANGEAPTDNETADKVGANQDKTQAEAFNTFLENGAYETKEGENEKKATDEKLTFLTIDGNKSTEKQAEEYKTKISDVGKSFVAKLDTGGDGYINEEEYVTYAKAQFGVTDGAAKAQFERLNQNGKDGIDWKEAAAMFHTMDTWATNPTIADGKISGKNVDAFLKTFNSAEDKNNVARRSFLMSYNNLQFDKKEE